MNSTLIHKYSYSQFNTTYSTEVSIFFFEELNIVVKLKEVNGVIVDYEYYGGTREDLNKLRVYLGDI